MDRLLVIVVTRDWASRGGPEDEFCVDWLQPCDKEYWWFPGSALHLLLVHGYAGRFNSEEAVRQAIDDHARESSVDSSYSGCVVLQHSTRYRIVGQFTVSGVSTEVRLATYGSTAGSVLEALDLVVSNLSDNSSDAREGWKKEFRKIAPVVARDRMAQLIHAIVHLFLPLEVDFSGLREASDEVSRTDYATEILRTRTGDSYEVRLRKLRFWVAKVEGDHVAVQSSSPLSSGQCFLELVLVCGLSLEDKLIEELVGLCGLIDNGGAFRPDDQERYETPREDDDQVGSFFKNLDEVQEAQALIKQSRAAVLKLGPNQKDLDFLEWFARLREVMEGIHDRLLSVRRDVGGGE